MDLHYYKVLLPKSRAVLKEMDKASGDAFIARKELMEEYHADGLFMDKKNVDTPSGLAFKKEQDSKFLVYKGFNGEFYKYAPKKSTNDGKELAAKLSNPDLKFSISDFILNTFNLNSAVSAGKKKKKYYPKVGVIGEQILIIIPGNPGMIGFPNIPFYLKEISEEEIIEITKSGDTPEKEEKGE